MGSPDIEIWNYFHQALLSYIKINVCQFLFTNDTRSQINLKMVSHLKEMLSEKDFALLIDDFINKDGVVMQGGIKEEFMRTVVIGEMQQGELFKIHNEFKCIRGNQDVK